MSQLTFVCSTCYACHLVRSAHRVIPSFALYGENVPASFTDPLHIEDIQSRSRKYLWRIASHRHLGLSQIIFLGAGPAQAQLEDQSIHCRAPTLLVVPAGTVHSFRFAADTEGFVLTVDLERLFGAVPGHLAAVQALFSAPRAVDLRRDTEFALRLGRLMHLLSAEFRQPDSVHSPVCGWLASSVLTVAAHLAALPDPPAATGSAELRVLRRFRELIEANLLRHWPIARYATQLKVSESTLNRLCRRMAGVTAFTLVQQRLALEARRRLLYVGGTVNGIAAELGFRDAAYFSRFFRRHSGVSPSSFRRSRAGG